jgi:hypothetical protein
MIKNMTDKETAVHLREYVKKIHGDFSWPTDACGYNQHMRFVTHRNNNWKNGSREEFNQFILEYANSLDNP